MDYDLIRRVVEMMKPLKRRYPAIISYAKHLERCSDDEAAKRREIEAFTDWIKRNPRLTTEREFDEPQYEGTKVPGIYFRIIVDREEEEMMNTLVALVKEFIFMNNIDIHRPDSKTALMETLKGLNLSDRYVDIFLRCRFFSKILSDEKKINFLLSLVDKTKQSVNVADVQETIMKELTESTVSNLCGPLKESTLTDIKHDINLLLKELNDDELDATTRDILESVSQFLRNPSDTTILTKLMQKLI